MTTTFTTTKTERVLLVRGTSKAAFTQLTGCSVTRSGTTATLTKTSHGLSNGDVVMIQGFSLEEFNGVFTVANSAANTFDYTIKADPGANPTGTPGTVDKATVSSVLDLSTKLGAIVSGVLQNTTTGPTLAAQVWVGFATANNEYDFFWSQVINGDVTLNVATPWRQLIGQAAMYVKYAIIGNTGQAVDCSIYAQELTNIVGN